jgi:peptide subunit release factor 1 (eRF1)
VYTGTILTEDGKEKKVNIDFEPFKPINTSLYLCDNKFHTQVLLLRFRSNLYVATMICVTVYMLLGLVTTACAR